MRDEHRHADFPYWADNLTEVTDGGALAGTFDSYDWGDATSTPSVMASSLCSVTSDS